MSDEALISIVSVACVFGAPLIWCVVDSVAKNWRQVRMSEHNVLLKREMIDRGFSADEIVRILEAGVGDPAPARRPVAAR